MDRHRIKMRWLLVLYISLMIFADLVSIGYTANIIISHNNESNDTIQCGNSLQLPCKTLQYVVNYIAADGDVIMLDGNASYVYSIENVTVDKNLTITSLNQSLLGRLRSSRKVGKSNFLVSSACLNISFVIFIGYHASEQNHASREPYFMVASSAGPLNIYITNSIFQPVDAANRIFGTKGDSLIKRSIYLINSSFIGFGCNLPFTWLYDTPQPNTKAVIQDCIFHHPPLDWCFKTARMEIRGCSLDTDIDHGFTELEISNTSGSININGGKNLTITNSFLMNMQIMNVTSVSMTNTFSSIQIKDVKFCLIKDSVMISNHGNDWFGGFDYGAITIQSSTVVFNNLTIVINQTLKYRFKMAKLHYPKKAWIDIIYGNKLAVMSDASNTFPYPIIDGSICLWCMPSYRPKYIQLAYEQQILYCNPLTDFQYTLEESKVSYDPDGRYRVTMPKVYKCPPQARCGEGRIVNLEPYWGYFRTGKRSKGNVSPLEFLTCPEHFCGNNESSNAFETSWQYCQGKRIGRLCGDCPENYIVPVIGSKQCLLMTDCDDGKIFWILWLLLCLFILTLYGFQQPIAKVICYCFEKYFRKKRVQRPIPREIQIENDEVLEEENNVPNNCHGPQENEEDRVCQTPPPQPLVPLPNIDHQRNQQQQLVDDHVDAHQLLEEHQQKNSLSGWFVIFISFYQTIYIIRPSRNTTSSSQIFSTINDVFFTLFTGTLDIVSPNVTMCPLQTQNADLIEFIKISPWIACISFTIFLIIILTYVVKFKRRQPHGNGYQNLEAPGENGWQERTLSHLQEGVTQMIFIAYIPISMLLLRLLRCVEINGEHYQFIQASNQCYSTTQIVAWIFLIFWSIFFCPALYVATRLLKMKKISVNEFVIVLIFPLQIVWYLIRIRMRRNDNEPAVNDDKENIYKVMSNPFKRNDENVPIQWLPIILFRAFILAIISTFVLNIEKRVLANTAFSVVLMIKDSVVWPYRSVRLNTLNIMCWCGLFLEILNSFFWSFANLSLVQEFSGLFVGFEFALLLAPILVLVFVNLYGLLFAKYLKRFFNKQD